MILRKGIEMKENLKLKFSRGDLATILVVIMMAVGLMAAFGRGSHSSMGEIAEIYQNGRKIKTVSLKQATKISIDGDYHSVIAVKDGRIAIVESDCPGMDCVHSGWIDRPGRSIVCLPNRLEVRIVGAAEVDIVVG